MDITASEKQAILAMRRKINEAEDQRITALVRYGINPRFNQRGSGVEPVACDDSDL